jgi:alcohol dehydrogenase
VATWFCELLLSSNGLIGAIGPDNSAETLAGWIENVSRRARLAGKLRECGVTSERLPELAAAATKQWTGTFNPVELTEQDFQRLYEAAL